MPALDVAAGAVVRGGRLLLARRSEPPEHAGAWELPGGKVRAGESLRACLERELREELGIEATVGSLVCRRRVTRPERTLAIHVFRVLEFRGEPRAIVHEALSWAVPAEWSTYRLVEADVALLECLGRHWSELVAGSEA